MICTFKSCPVKIRLRSLSADSTLKSMFIPLGYFSASQASKAQACQTKASDDEYDNYFEKNEKLSAPKCRSILTSWIVENPNSHPVHNEGEDFINAKVDERLLDIGHNSGNRIRCAAKLILKCSILILVIVIVGALKHLHEQNSNLYGNSYNNSNYNKSSSTRHGNGGNYWYSGTGGNNRRYRNGNYHTSNNGYSGGSNYHS